MQRPHRRDEIGEPEGQTETEETPSVDEQQCQHHVQRVLAEVDDERRACVLMGVEHPEHEEVEREADKTEGEAGKSSRGVERVGRGELAVFERGADDRPAQDEEPEARRQGDEGDQPDAQR